MLPGYVSSGQHKKVMHGFSCLLYSDRTLFMVLHEDRMEKMDLSPCQFGTALWMERSCQSLYIYFDSMYSMMYGGVV